MKRLILNVLVLVLFLTGLFIVKANASWADKFPDGRISYLSEDPNEAEEDNPPKE